MNNDTIETSDEEGAPVSFISLQSPGVSTENSIPWACPQPVALCPGAIETRVNELEAMDANMNVKSIYVHVKGSDRGLYYVRQHL